MAARVTRLHTGRRTGQLKKDERDVAARLLRSVRARCRARGIDCTITADDIPVPTHCPVFGTPLDHFGSTGRVDDRPSVDRLDPTKGYVPGNVAVISMRANRLKSNMTATEVAALLMYIVEREHE